MLAALDETSMQSRRRRFFASKRHFSEQERAFFMDIDFKTHVALVACVEDAGRRVIAGGGRYVVSEPGRAEVAFMVIDAWQGRGLGAMLAHDIVALAREARLTELNAEVVHENVAMRHVLEKLGFEPAATHDPHTVHLALKLS